MKTLVHSATATEQRRQRNAGEPSTRLRRGRAEGSQGAQGRARQKTGAYKRVEIFLGLDAAIALRQLMRDGRSAREVIEALLVEEQGRRKEGSAPGAGRTR